MDLLERFIFRWHSYIGWVLFDWPGCSFLTSFLWRPARTGHIH